MSRDFKAINKAIFAMATLCIYYSVTETSKCELELICQMVCCTETSGKLFYFKSMRKRKHFQEVHLLCDRMKPVGKIRFSPQPSILSSFYHLCSLFSRVAADQEWLSSHCKICASVSWLKVAWPVIPIPFTKVFFHEQSLVPLRFRVISSGT